MPKTVVVADDSIIIQKTVGICLHGAKLNIVNTDNGEDAWQKIRALKPDLVLADHSMPRKNGFEICRAMRQKRELESIPVILLTNRMDPPDESMMESAGISDFIAKPFDSQSLITIVEKFIGDTEEEQAEEPREQEKQIPSDVITETPQGTQIQASPEDFESVEIIEDIPLEATEETPSSPQISTDANISRSTQKPGELVEKIVRETVGKIAGGIIEKIAWEVVPEMAEIIIRQEIKRLLAEEEEKTAVEK